MTTAQDTAPIDPGRRELLLGGTLLVTAAAAGVVRFRSVDVQSTARPALGQMIPNRVGDWVRQPFADILIPVGETGEDKTYDDLFTGYYADVGGAGIMLLIAYGSAQVGDTELHRPEVCYPAAGFRLKRWPDVTLDFAGKQVRAAVTTASAPERIEQMLYWSRLGHDFPTTSLAQRWSILRQMLRGAVPDGVLVRMSTINGDREEGLAILEQFAGDLMMSAPPALRTMLVGTA
ncbi:exosortase C-terminal domain/associated protein EpsI [Sphingomonas sp.]|uniref:exosortase C-terminal domain/associated protein EpsI n=1 Tax=Sphingomonas sp. TaxID=28214 RepID=UPI0025D07179|nr:exosortase C-terminal domain/associated protein EpsI [Sphingomonas sp.]MBV9528631.1 EpsI family protein [Sphingomonas sp.]